MFASLQQRRNKDFMSKVCSAAEPSDSELDEGELCFMEDLVDILEASHFRLLSEEDWATAQAEEFTVGR